MVVKTVADLIALLETEEADAPLHVSGDTYFDGYIGVGAGETYHQLELG